MNILTWIKSWSRPANSLSESEAKKLVQREQDAIRLRLLELEAKIQIQHSDGGSS